MAADNSSVCAVHGLNGNAFGTWATNGRMWLRDFLPGHERFEKSRIMTFGYSSILSDNRNTASLAEWAHSLLQALVSARQSEAVCNPLPAVLVSMGGHCFPNTSYL